MKKILLHTFILISPFWLNAQNVSINQGGAAPDNSAMLDVSSTTSGLLIPRMSQTQRNALVSPAPSLLIYQTDNTPGYYFNSGTAASPVWTQLGSPDNLGDHIATTNIQLGTNYLSGDGDNEGIYINNTGNIGVGTTTPAGKIDIVDNAEEFSINITNSTNSATDKKGVFSIVTGGGIGDSYGIYGEANAASGDKFGVFGGAVGAGGIKYGLYGDASGAGTNWAGYFNDGNVYIDNLLGIGVTPTNALSVAGNIDVTSTNFLTTAIESSNIDGTWLTLGNTSTSGKYYQIVSTGSNNTGGAGKLMFGYGPTPNNVTGAAMVLVDDQVGIGTLAPDSTLDVNGGIKASYFTLTDGAASGSVLTSDANGVATWQAPSGADDLIQDTDGDTRIETEAFADEDVIRLTTNGTEYFNIQDGRINVTNTGSSVFLGNRAGENDDLSSNASTFIGSFAGNQMTTGFGNTAVGANALSNVTTQGSNTAVGFNALRSNTGIENTAVGYNSLAANTSNSNVALGYFSLNSNIVGTDNVAIGYDALRSNLGSRNIALGYQAGANETGSDKLYIENSNSVNPLIYGDFANDSLIINGALSVSRNYTFPATAPVSSGDVLQYNGTSLVWGTGGGASNFGSGTLGQLTYFTADDSLRSSNELFWDEGTSSLGVGTSAPSGKLEVAGDGSLIGGLRVSGTTATTVGASIYIDGANQDWTIYGSNNSSGSGANKLVFRDYTNAADRMTIDNAGNVGIGTTNPNRRLHIHATSGAGNLQLTSASTGISTADGFTLSNDGTTRLIMWQHENADWQFVTHTGTTAITIDPTANVGIGTTVPSSELEVVGDIEIPAANDYTYSTAKTHYQSYAPTTFNSQFPSSNDFQTFNAVTLYAHFANGSGAIGYSTVSVNLPDGAVVTDLEGWIYDNLATSPARLRLIRQELGTATSLTMATIESTTATATNIVQNLTDNTIFGGTIDNERYSYFLRFSGADNSTLTRLYGARITYTVTEAD